MKAIVVDDEKHVREALLKMLQIFCPDVEVVGEAESVSTAAKLIQSTTFDLAFLDIQLKGGTSLELLEMFPDRKFHFIFITAFDQFAIKAMKFSSLDYLLKPIEPENLIKAVAKLPQQNPEQYIALMEFLKREKSNTILW